MTKGDEVARTRRISGKDANNIRHSFSRLNNGAGYYLAREAGPREMDIYWVGLDFKVIAAVSITEANGTAAVPAQDAEKKLAAEYAEWVEDRRQALSQLSFEEPDMEARKT